MRNLLIIDDEAQIRKIIKIQLKNEDIMVYEAENKDKAFDLLKTVPINLIICDIKMKDTNGFVILKDLNIQYSHIPVIMLTGFIDKKVSVKAKCMGCYDFITKPVRREKLIETISRAFADKKPEAGNG
ncbi:MAG: response regulator [Spirochaetales bacterium]|nr:response regulator [Spirochaetales bacterium]